MKTRVPSAIALHLLLVLTSLFQVAGHDLLCEHGDRGASCAVDRGAVDRSAVDRSGAGPGGGSESSASPAGPQLSRCTPQAEHECPCCGACGQRISLGTASTTWRPPALAGAPGRPVTGLLARQLPPNHPSRGPPAGRVPEAL